MNEISKNIKKLRKQKGWSQRQAAEQLAISVPAFSKIETGTTDLNISRLNQIARLFKVTPMELMASEEANPQVLHTLKVGQLKKQLAKKEAEVIQLQDEIIDLFERIRAKKKGH
ncbi:MAG: helix-turn-helix transcriptional regulator [Candidatus Pedobacter colombiensis]|uniref:Helix-turn-helix transcriptional regulator n=1 Tax=Candidatus Pedobacter colombiensis TaxID=3121371 RepID=A0AAJ6B7M2_9SPHI|nr:helix-turn-helix transcriptional regulator [Pedobacter sp.]WEK19651.1 MAG: helix-turn-helix transcriptional regulator [Pedobacter sp.]